MRVPNSINLRQEMIEMLEDYGTWVLFQRNSKRVNCTCWNEKFQEGNPKHTLCAGTGWLVRLERRQMRKIGASIPISEPSLLQQTELGHMSVQQFRWYMPHDVHPRPGDQIYEIEWDLKDPNKPVGLVSAHIINTTSDVRGDHGKLEYFEAATRTVLTNLKLQNIIIRSLGRVKDYLIGGQPNG